MASTYGSKIRLISKKLIRYEGTLSKINETDNTVTLQDVQIFGTEDRDCEQFVPKTPGSYQEVVFKGSDIANLEVLDPPKSRLASVDPAVMAVKEADPNKPRPQTAGPRMHEPLQPAHSQSMGGKGGTNMYGQNLYGSSGGGGKFGGGGGGGGGSKGFYDRYTTDDSFFDAPSKGSKGGGGGGWQQQQQQDWSGGSLYWDRNRSHNNNNDWARGGKGGHRDGGYGKGGGGGGDHWAQRDSGSKGRGGGGYGGGGGKRGGYYGGGGGKGGGGKGAGSKGGKPRSSDHSGMNFKATSENVSEKLKANLNTNFDFSEVATKSKDFENERDKADEPVKKTQKYDKDSFYDNLGAKSTNDERRGKLSPEERRKCHDDDIQTFGKAAVQGVEKSFQRSRRGRSRW
ncbi:kinesin [Diplonema papillatum]|nr:kinesin [Diplonema papillatum]